jgi:hypothetical protein
MAAADVEHDDGANISAASPCSVIVGSAFSYAVIGASDLMFPGPPELIPAARRNSEKLVNTVILCVALTVKGRSHPLHLP